MPRWLASRCLAVEIDGPSLEFGSGRAEHRPAVACDQEGQKWRVPFDFFHSADEFVPRHADMITAEIVPDSGEQALKVGCLFDGTRV